LRPAARRVHFEREQASGMSRFFRTGTRGGDDRALDDEAGHLLPRHAFAASLAHSLRLLRSIHVPLTLFAVQLPAQGIVAADETVSATLLPFGVVGRLPDGRIGLLYLGPHTLGEAGGRALSTHLLDKIERRLRDHGWGALCPGVRLTAVQVWSDAIAHPSHLLQALDQRWAVSTTIGEPEDAPASRHAGRPSRA
jgi:hypothetical protein